jgi:hypothetical protein
MSSVIRVTAEVESEVDLQRAQTLKQATLAKALGS